MKTFDIHLEGFDAGAAEPPLPALQRLFQIDEVAAAALLRSLPRIVKHDVEQAKAEQIRAALQGVGARVSLRPCPIRPKAVVQVGAPSHAPVAPLPDMRSAPPPGGEVPDQPGPAPTPPPMRSQPAAARGTGATARLGADGDPWAPTRSLRPSAQRVSIPVDGLTASKPPAAATPAEDPAAPTKTHAVVPPIDSPSPTDALPIDRGVLASAAPQSPGQTPTSLPVAAAVGFAAIEFGADDDPPDSGDSMQIVHDPMEFLEAAQQPAAGAATPSLDVEDQPPRRAAPSVVGLDELDDDLALPDSDAPPRSQDSSLAPTPTANVQAATATSTPPGNTARPPIGRAPPARPASAEARLRAFGLLAAIAVVTMIAYAVLV